jgi:hypothetical protein
MMKLVTLIQQFQTGKKTKQNQKSEWIKQGRFSPFFHVVTFNQIRIVCFPNVADDKSSGFSNFPASPTSQAVGLFLMTFRHM